ncbi:MlaD family protein [Hoylesella marshii]|uniref:MlaD family protein n=1 Tax=Hoylesella marshii TaxID=189722 RepID=UPI0028D851EF|nr:MlaD family protein [Hoylesella marshii]
MQFFTKEVKIALVAIVGGVILFYGLNFLKGITVFSSDNSYTIAFHNISGLSTSSPIYADGYRVGVVKSIDYDYRNHDTILVHVDINKEFRIPKGSSAEIVSDLLGNIQVNLLLANNPRERIEPGEVIVGNLNDGAVGQMKDMIPTIQKMLPKLDSIMASINVLLADPAIAQSLHNVRTITSDLTVSTKQLNVLMTTLNHRVPGMLGKADDILSNTQQLTNNLAQIDVTSTMAKIDATLDGVQLFTQKLNNEQGTLGLLLNDPSLYNRINTTVLSVDSLLVNIKQHPKRYVHFSLFGKKDK